MKGGVRYPRGLHLEEADSEQCQCHCQRCKMTRREKDFELLSVCCMGLGEWSNVSSGNLGCP